MNRAKYNHVVLHTLLSVLMLAALCGISAAQSATTAQTVTALKNQYAHNKRAAVAARVAQKHRAATPITHPFYSPNMKSLPAGITQRQFNVSAATGRNVLWAGKPLHRAPGDQAVIRQTVLLTPLDPTVQYSTTPDTAINQHPFWTSDEKYIYFDSTRVSDTVTTPNATGTFNLYRELPDGTGVVAIQPTTANQIEPNVSTDGGTVAYVSGGTYTYASGLTGFTTSGFNLYTVSVNGGTPTQWTDNSPQFNFADVRHPSWAPGSTAIAFAAKLQGDTVYHIYTVNIASGTITQLTSGASNDYSPAWSPDGNLIAFTTNASAFTGNQAPTVGAAGKNDDIYVVNVNPLAVYPTRVTNFAANGVQSSNRNPSWSTLKIDPLGIIPPETTTSGNGLRQSEELLAFGSTRQDTNHDGIANNVGTTTDIYWLHARVTPVQNGVYTVSTPESAGNPAHKLQTSEPDTAIDPTDPTYNFDPNFISNEDYPTWPQYQSSYRIVYQSDKGGHLNLWGSMILDINAPTLLKYNISTNEIVNVVENTAPSVSVRQVNAGDTVRFRARVVDYESGVESVYFQIKCPDSAEQSADGVEHKVFAAEDPFMDTTNYIVNAPYEYDAQAVDAYSTTTNGTPRFKALGSNAAEVPVLPNWPGANMYDPGVEDSVAFSGGANTPDEPNYVPFGAPAGTPPSKPKDGQGGFWLRLYDDGPVSQGGHEPEGETAGDGVFTAVWQTPPGFPSDWLIDVIVRDMAINPFDTGQRINWKIYDNVWGFTSKPFQAKSNVLYVSDYDTGQKFLGGRFGSFGSQGTQSGTNELGLTFSGTPTESWMTEFDPNLFPTTWMTVGSPIAKPLANFLTGLGQYSYTDGLDNDGTLIPPTQRYDIWRIQCRGPIPTNILNIYAPYTQTQIYDPIAHNTPDPALIAERCVIWHAPYTGDLFVGPGTLLDSSVQTQLAAFVAAGGRVMVQGQDVAWGLTLGGSQPSSFLTQTLQANYVADDVFLQAGSLAPDQLIMTAADPAGASRGGLPIGWETWYPPIVHAYPGPVIPNTPPATQSVYIGDVPPSTIKEWECPNQGNGIGYPDVVSFTPAPTTNVDNIDAKFGGITTPAIMWFTNTTTAIHSKIVFSPFSWETVHPEWQILGTEGLLWNRRTELIHNALDYMRTGRITGTVHVINPSGTATGPLGGVTVTARDGHGNVRVTTSLNDGSYILNGLDPTGVYALDAIKAGYVTQHATGGAFHGSYQNKQDFYMTQAQPGGVSGQITIYGSGLPVANVVVTATDSSNPSNPNPPTFRSNPSDVKGNYSFSNLPASTYTIFIAQADLTAAGYTSSVPVSYTNVTVASGQTVGGENFALKQAPGRILGKVDIANSAGTDTGTPLPGAIVTATATTGTPPEQFTSAKTGADGTYVITGVDPGAYTVVATAPGYAPNSPITVNVATNADTTGVNIALKKIPPGSVAGLIETSVGNTVDGATVTVVDAAGNTYTATSFNPPQTGTDANGNSYQYNYLVSNVAAGGNVTVTATKPGYTPKPDPDTQTVQVNASAVTAGVNFTLDPLYSYSASLSLVSAPFNFNLDVTKLLSVPSADVSSGAFSFVTWNATTQQYVYYPTPPADQFHLGVGYFMQDTALGATSSLPLTNPNGVTAPKDPVSGAYLPYNIPLHVGWNLIGTPYTNSLDFSLLQVQDASGNLFNVPLAQTGGTTAVPTPILGAALWTYQNGAYEYVYTLDPYRGYWLRAYEPLTLIVSPGAIQGRGVSTHPTRALEFSNSQASNWKLQLMAQVGSRQSGNSYVGTNRSATDKYDQYKLATPPMVNKQDVAITFDHTDWGKQSGSYSVDVRSPAATTWDFTVHSTIPNKSVTLTWPNLATTGQHTMTLIDLDNNTRFELHNRANYVIPASSTAIAHHFELQVGRATRSPLQLMDVSAQLAAATKGVAPTSASISYTLTADATVQVRILKQGRSIRTLEPGDTRAAGANSVIWDLKNDRGILVPSDVYTVEVRATDNNGHLVHQPSTLVITR